MRALFIPATLVLFSCACGPSVSTIRSYVSTSPQRKIAIIPFKQPYADGTQGQEAADIFTKYLTEMGFVVVNRMDLETILNEQKLSLSGMIKPEDAIELGKLIGADLLITGSVAQASQQMIIENQPGPPMPGERRHSPPGGNRVQVSSYAATAKLTNLTTGEIIWVDSGSAQMEYASLPDTADYVLKVLARKLGTRFLQNRL